eukprot:scaffold529_cov308-Pinguiococcus_pyrenoidosus.AAC.53
MRFWRRRCGDIFASPRAPRARLARLTLAAPLGEDAESEAGPPADGAQEAQGVHRAPDLHGDAGPRRQLRLHQSAGAQRVQQHLVQESGLPRVWPVPGSGPRVPLHAHQPAAARPAQHELPGGGGRAQRLRAPGHQGHDPRRAAGRAQAAGQRAGPRAQEGGHVHPPVLRARRGQRGARDGPPAAGALRPGAQRHGRCLVRSPRLHRGEPGAL